MTNTKCLQDVKKEVKEEVSKYVQRKAETGIKDDKSQEMEEEVKEEMTQKAAVMAVWECASFYSGRGSLLLLSLILPSHDMQHPDFTHCIASSHAGGLSCC